MNFSRGYGSWPTLHVPRVYTCSVTSRVHTRGRASTCTNTTVCIAVQDLPRHRHSDPRLSVSFQSQTRWMAGEWKSWLKPNPTPLHPSIGWKGGRRKRENARGRTPHHSVCDHPYTERATTLALFRASISYHPLSRLLCLKIQIRRRKEIARNLLFFPLRFNICRIAYFFHGDIFKFLEQPLEVFPISVRLSLDI